MLSESNHDGSAPSLSVPRPRRQGRLSNWFEGGAFRRFGTDPARFDPAFLEKVERAAGVAFGPGRYFGLTVRGLENIPASQVMLVSNHSGGTTIPDVWGFALAWYRKFGTRRPLHILAHELLFAIPFFASLFERLGVLRASRETARTIISQHKDLLIYPGGDIETWRPYSRRYQLDFAGRTGYAQLGLEAQLPIVPIAHCGAHETLRVLTSGRGFARALGLHKIARAEVWPIHLCLPWGLALGPLPHIPLPANFRYLVGEPIGPVETGEGAIDRLDVKVRAAIQRQLDVLCAEDFAHQERRRAARPKSPSKNRRRSDLQDQR